jgi:CRISPR-associated protein Cmr3
MATFELTPRDTMFFRGGEPMTMGESHFQTSIFPPSPESIIGALRTAIISRNSQNDFAGYLKGTYAEAEWCREIGIRELPGSFVFAGPFLMAKKGLLLTPPATLFHDSKTRQFRLAAPRAMTGAVHSGPLGQVLWLGRRTGEQNDWKQAEGYLTSDGMKKVLNESVDSLDPDRDFMHANDLYATEDRIGIALEPGLRTAKKGHLYATRHTRFHKDVRMLVVVNGVPSLPDNAVLQLGGENRTATCLKVADLTLPVAGKETDFLVTTTPMKVKQVVNGVPVTDILDKDMNVLLPGGMKAKLIAYAVNKPLLFGGWDMAAKRVKDMVQYLPAGSVFHFERCSVIGANPAFLLGGSHV